MYSKNSKHNYAARDSLKPRIGVVRDFVPIWAEWLHAILHTGDGSHGYLLEAGKHCCQHSLDAGGTWRAPNAWMIKAK